MESESDQEEACATCGLENGRIEWLERQIRELVEKLEHSQLQNALLTSECDRMGRELREAVFRGRFRRDGRTRVTCHSLPIEVLRHIFALATQFDDSLVSRRDGTVEREWELSSTTRRAIPLVCQKWNVVGSEFLFEHIVLRRISQPLALLWTLNALNSVDQGRILGYIRGLEISMCEEVDDATIFGEVAVLLIRKLPYGQLRRFGVDCGKCDGVRASSITSILASVIKRSGGRLETLHLPCAVRLEQEELPQDMPESEEQNLWQFIASANLQLRTLSLMGGYWNHCNSSIFNIQSETGFLTTLGQCIQSVDTLFLCCSYFSTQNEAKLLEFLNGGVNIKTVHFISRIPGEDVPNLQLMLEKLPRLCHLFITHHIQDIATISWPAESSHPSLEEITISYKARCSVDKISSSMNELTDRVKSSNFPNLRRITICGRFPKGCLDPDYILSSAEYHSWASTIDHFAEVGIELVNQDGIPLYLWCQRHAVKWRAGSVSSPRDTESEEDQWHEVSDEERAAMSSSSESGVISDDSDDEPYKYVHRRDLSESEEETE
ncbi:hypothetical protein M408DRAFT_157688 [Serendipita vermifera MAFF 305830]|uniref:Uncharacterized protein n=1 Tax=Serendipita vermifera MAFF 305830 TaxID=933852 RepID=A0A0C3BQC2_SERVB|nr:hypothetical protein M408DRAFT_157688 [Serendipita vermifera MAFF 305830]